MTNYMITFTLLYDHFPSFEEAKELFDMAKEKWPEFEWQGPSAPDLVDQKPDIFSVTCYGTPREED